MSSGGGLHAGHWTHGVRKLSEIFTAHIIECLDSRAEPQTRALKRLFFVCSTVSGFGVTNEQNRRILTNKLKYVYLPVVDQQICRDSIAAEKSKKPNTPALTDNMFCAGFPEGGRDSCQGDSGSPFAFSDDNNRIWAAGIVSWGIECGRQGTYSVYTSVTKYLGWINKTMHEN